MAKYFKRNFFKLFFGGNGKYVGCGNQDKCFDKSTNKKSTALSSAFKYVLKNYFIISFLVAVASPSFILIMYTEGARLETLSSLPLSVV